MSATLDPITPSGHAALCAEVDRLIGSVRPAAAAELAESARAHGFGDHSGAHRRLADIDARIRMLRARLAAVHIVEPGTADPHRVSFGATVRLLAEDGAETQVTLLGPDEIDPAAGAISVRSPMARALLRAAPGDTVEVRAPSGAASYEILSVAHPRRGGIAPSTA